MGFRLRKSKKIGPFRLNISKSGLGWSVGSKGFRYTKKASGGSKQTWSIPGTGLSYVTDSSKKSKSNKTSGRTHTVSSNADSHRFSQQPTNGKGCLWWLLIGWWFWIVEYAIWLFAKPVYIAYLYTKHLLDRSNTDKFNPSDFEQSDKIDELTSKTIYKTQFYKTNTFFVLMCIFCPVIALLTILLKKDVRSKKKNIVIFCVFALWWIVFSLVNCDNTNQNAASNTDSFVSSADSAIISGSDTSISGSDVIERQTTTTTTTITTTTSTTTTTTTSTTTTSPTTTTKYIQMVWISSTGSRYHRKASCSNMNSPHQIPLEDATKKGLTPCGRCY